MDKQHEELLNEKLEHAGMIEQMVLTKGWEFVRIFIETKIKEFSSDSINKGYKDMSEYNFFRGQVYGLLQIVGLIDDHINELYEYRKKQQSQPAPTE